MILTIVLSAAWAALVPAGAGAQVSVSSTTEKMVEDLEDLARQGADRRFQARAASYFDQARARGHDPVILDPRGRPTAASRMRVDPVRPVTRNPAVEIWLRQGPRLAYAGRGRYYMTPPPPRIYAYPPNPFPYDNRGYWMPYPSLPWWGGGGGWPGNGGWQDGGGWLPHPDSFLPWQGGFSGFFGGLLPGWFGPPDDGGRGGAFGVPGYRYVPGHGYVPDFGFKEGHRFVPGRGIIP